MVIKKDSKQSYLKINVILNFNDSLTRAANQDR